MNQKIFDRLTDIAFSLYPNNKYNGKNFHVSFILRNNKLLTTGINNPFKTNTKNLKYNYTNNRGEPFNDESGTHSEMCAAIRHGEDDYSKLTLVNIRIDNNKNLAYSRPCTGCTSLIVQLNFKKVFYTSNDGKFEDFNFIK